MPEVPCFGLLNGRGCMSVKLAILVAVMKRRSDMPLFLITASNARRDRCKETEKGTDHPDSSSRHLLVLFATFIILPLVGVLLVFRQGPDPLVGGLQQFLRVLAEPLIFVVLRSEEFQAPCEPSLRRPPVDMPLLLVSLRLPRLLSALGSRCQCTWI